MAQKLLKLDYTGICFSICVTNLSSTYFGLHDKLWWQMFYNTFCILCGIGVLVLLLGPNTNGPGAALFRYVLRSHYVDNLQHLLLAPCIAIMVDVCHLILTGNC